MKWMLNSSAACTAADLGAHLTSEMNDFCKMQPQSIARQQMPAAMPEDADYRDPTRMEMLKRIMEEKRAPMVAAATAKLPELCTQMTAAIEAAVALAKVMGADATKFLVTLSGHHDPGHVTGIEERVIVSIDVAPARGTGTDPAMSQS